MVETALPVADLLAQGTCSPMCLLAQEPGNLPCTCRCRGEYHAALADATVPGPSITRWWEKSGMAGWQSFTEMPGGMTPSPNTFAGMFIIPVARNESQDHHLYRKFIEAKRDAFYIRSFPGPGGGWEVLRDAYTIGDSEPWGDRESRLMNRLAENLLLQRRISQASPFPTSHGVLSGFKNLEEACVTYLIIGECLVGNVSSVVRAIEVLEGRPDPVVLGYHPEHGFPEELAYGKPTGQA